MGYGGLLQLAFLLAMALRKRQQNGQPMLHLPNHVDINRIRRVGIRLSKLLILALFLVFSAFLSLIFALVGLTIAIVGPHWLGITFVVVALACIASMFWSGWRIRVILNDAGVMVIDAPVRPQ